MVLALALVHLTVAAIWLGSMGYSLFVVQPRVARFFEDDLRREEFLTTLAQGNRWRVVGLIAVLLCTAVGLAVASEGAARLAYVGVFIAYGVAALIFSNVSWRHWPARVFALPEEVPAYQRALRKQAKAMLALVGLAYLTALATSLAG